MKMKKLLISSIIGVSLLASTQSAFAATYSSSIETNDIVYNHDGDGARNIELNEYFMGYISGPNPITKVSDRGDSFKWTNTTDHDIAIEVWLFSPMYSNPSGSDDGYDLSVRPDDKPHGYQSQENGPYSYAKFYGYEHGEQIIIKPGRSAFFQVTSGWSKSYSKTKNYVIWMNEVPIKK